MSGIARPLDHPVFQPTAEGRRGGRARPLVLPLEHPVFQPTAEGRRGGKTSALLRPLEREVFQRRRWSTTA